jgi:dTDP-4-dehydrorhamnose 3,5-epimerase
MKKIDGVNITKIESHIDERGFFREVLKKETIGGPSLFGQLSYSKVYQGTVKAWHGHKLQEQWTFIMTGFLEVRLFDDRSTSPTYKNIMEFYTGDELEPIIYSFPPGVLHGYKCIGGPALVLYVTSNVYDPDEEIRLNFNDPKIGHDWNLKNIR